MKKILSELSGQALIEALRKRVKTRDPDEPTPEVKYRCEQCKDEGGWIEKVSKELYPYPVDEWVICPCIAQEATEKLFTASEITHGMRRMCAQPFILEGRPECVKEAYEKAQHYFWHFNEIKDTENNSIAFLGASGSGKTRLLLGVALDLIESGIQVLYFPFVEAMNELKSSLRSDDAISYRHKEFTLQRAPVLYIDDLFKSETKLQRGPSDYELKFMFSIINYRYLNFLPMLISSEFDITQIVGFDEALGSRIDEMTKEHQVMMKGKGLNYRLRLIKGDGHG